MRQLEETFEETLEHLEKYLRVKYQLLKLRLFDKCAKLGAVIIIKLIALLFLLLGFVFFNFALAIFLGDILGEEYYGYGIVAGFYILMFLVFQVFFYKSIREFFVRYFIKKLLKHVL